MPVTELVILSLIIVNLVIPSRIYKIDKGFKLSIIPIGNMQYARKASLFYRRASPNW